MERVQAGLLEQFLTHVWAPRMVQVVTDSTDRKICQVMQPRRPHLTELLSIFVVSSLQTDRVLSMSASEARMFLW